MTSVSGITSNIFNNIDRFLLSSKEEFTGLSVSGFHRQNRYSSRLACKCTLTFRTLDGQQKKRIVWAKKVNLPEKSYQTLLTVWSALDQKNLSECVTRPYWYDNYLGIIYIENIDGSSLLEKTLVHGVLGGSRPKESLSRLYLDLGTWLSDFHISLTSPKYSSLYQVKAQIKTALDSTSWLTPWEKTKFKRRLLNTGNARKNIRLALVRPHNDFSLRNILVSGNQFGIIDWDAMVHPHLPDLAPAWYEISFFLINLQSLLRFHPIISKPFIAALKNEFLRGYFSAIPIDLGTQEMMLYLFTLRHFLGLDSDRTLPRIYRSRFGKRYIRLLKRALLSGQAALV